MHAHTQTGRCDSPCLSTLARWLGKFDVWRLGWWMNRHWGWQWLPMIDDIWLAVTFMHHLSTTYMNSRRLDLGAKCEGHCTGNKKVVGRVARHQSVSHNDRTWFSSFARQRRRRHSWQPKTTTTYQHSTNNSGDQTLIKIWAFPLFNFFL